MDQCQKYNKKEDLHYLKHFKTANQQLKQIK